MAHLAMLSCQGIVPAEAAGAIHEGLVGLWRDAEAGVFVPAVKTCTWRWRPS